jgi:hypothetical protein
MAWLITLACAAFAAGCLEVDRLEVRIRYDERAEPTELAITYTNLSSSADDPKELDGDFEAILTAWKGDKYLVERAEKGLVVKDRRVYIEGGRLQAREVLLPLPGAEEIAAEDMVVVGGERLVVLSRSEGKVIETDGKVFETERNTVIAWPEDQREIYWIQDQQATTSDAKRKRLEENGRALAERFEAYRTQNPEPR